MTYFRRQRYEMNYLRGTLADRPPYRKFLVLTGFILFGAVFSSLLGSLVSSWMTGVSPFSDPARMSTYSDPQVVRSLKIIQAFAALGTFLLPSLLAAWLFNPAGQALIPLPRPASLLVPALVIFFSFSSVPFINALLDFNQDLKLPPGMQALEEQMLASEKQAERITEAFLGSISWRGLWVNLIILALIPAFGEEFLFRGIIQPLFRNTLKSPLAAIIVTSLLFSALHFQFYGFLPRFLLGVWLGLLSYWSGGLTLSVIAHFVNNASAVILAWYFNRKGELHQADEWGLRPGDEMLLGLSVLFSLVLALLIYKLLRPKAESA